jgi:hypothetical protein
LAAAIAAIGIVVALGWLAYSIRGDLNAAQGSQGHSQAAQVRDPLPTEAAQPTYEAIALGSTLEWEADKSPDEVVRRAGPFIVAVSKKVDGEFVSPVVRVTSGTQTITMEGESVSPSFSHRISFFNNRSGAGPAVMLQSFSGGAHCCNAIKVAGFVGDKLRVIELGSWDGDEINMPTDVSGDGRVDFVMNDNRFLYAFACYACSRSPPQVFNIVDGEFRDVSRNPAYRSLYLKEMREAGIQCSPGRDTANGACPAFVASAARVGKLDEAWRQMLAAYDASADWDFPTGCRVADDKGCPPGAEVVYKSYPEALLGFLKRQGYVSKNWFPPETFTAPLATSSPDDQYVS